MYIVFLCFQRRCTSSSMMMYIVFNDDVHRLRRRCTSSLKNKKDDVNHLKRHKYKRKTMYIVTSSSIFLVNIVFLLHGRRGGTKFVSSFLSRYLLVTKNNHFWASMIDSNCPKRNFKRFHHSDLRENWYSLQNHKICWKISKNINIFNYFILYF